MTDYTIEPDHANGGFDVYEHGEYEESSVLAGMPRRSYGGHYDTVKEAKAEFPKASVLEHSTRTEPVVPDV